MSGRHSSEIPLAFTELEAVPTNSGASRIREQVLSRRQRMDRQAALRREQLLEVAFSLFQEEGLQGFNMRELGLRAGYTPGALYAYFDGKAAILLALRERLLERLAAELRRSETRRHKVREHTGGPSDEPTERDDWPMQRFLRLSRVWWRWLAADMLRLRLLLAVDQPVQTLPLRKAQPTKAVEPHSGLQGGLIGACAPCLACLQSAGLPDDVARQLHADALTWGVGLLVLNADLAGSDELEHRFAHGLEQRLAAVGQVFIGIETGHPHQADLFGR